MNQDKKSKQDVEIWLKLSDDIHELRKILSIVLIRVTKLEQKLKGIGK